MEERPENTMTAFKRAYEQGADVIEVDLCPCKDGHLLILHDSMLYRTIDGPSEHSHFVKKGYPVVNRNCSIIQGITKSES